MACDASVPPPPVSTDPLDSSQQRFAELSLRVDQTKPLTNSQSRVVVLVPHKKELAQLAFDKPSTALASSATLTSMFEFAFIPTRFRTTPGSAQQRILTILTIVFGSYLTPPPSCSRCLCKCFAPIQIAALIPPRFARSFYLRSNVSSCPIMRNALTVKCSSILIWRSTNKLKFAFLFSLRLLFNA
ncbi:hypothetical protein COOONC_00839 [Cooperia oncophora]